MDAKLQDLQTRKDQAYNAGSPRSVERQHEKGKLLARERITTLLDPDSFHELDLLARHRAHAAGLEERPYTDGVITGWGTIDGRKVFVYSQDFTVFGGALGEVFAEKIHKLMDLALKVGAPVIGLNDGAGARIQEGVVSLASYGGIFYRNVQASGVVPQISVILGPCAGGAVYSPAMTDFIFMVRETSHMFITGPDVVKTVTGEEVTLEELGGAMSHASKSGVATFVSADEQSCLQDVRYLLSFLPQNNLAEVPASEATDDPTRLCESLRTILPTSPNQPYDMKKVITEVMDDGEFFEYFPHWAKSIVCGSHDLMAKQLESSVTSQWCWPEYSILKAAKRQRGLCAPAMHSTFRLSLLLMCPDSFLVSTKSTAALFATVQSCCMHIAKAPFHASK